LTVPLTAPGTHDVYVRNLAMDSPVPDGVSVAVPLFAAALAVFVFARQRGPSRIVRLHLARPDEVRTRRRLAWPRLVPTPREKAALSALYQIWQRSLRTIGSPALQENAFANSGRVDGGPIARNCDSGWGLVFMRSFASSGRMFAAQTRAHARNSR